MDIWAEEIRDYLLGRLAAAPRVQSLLASQRTHLSHPPVRRWWVLEGKQYATLGGPLAANWHAVIRMARRLDATFNPRIRISDRASDGVVDWGYTLARGAQRQREYVVHSSGIGLSEDERDALRGWGLWIRDEWNEYASVVNIGPCPDASVCELAQQQEPATDDRLRRWAQTARRSRWPLLRDVVAESIRPVLEPDELDRIPLPSNHATLFELLCLVRVARNLAPRPREVRWLSVDTSGNTVRLQGLTCHYQQSLTRDAVLATSDYAGPLAAAVEVFRVGIPKFVDLAFDFDEPRSGFDGLIIEAKSGRRQFEHTVAQLRTYRAARPRMPGGRYVVWGIVENPDGQRLNINQLARIIESAKGEEDLWLFSSADDITPVLGVLFGASTS